MLDHSRRFSSALFISSVLIILLSSCGGSGGDPTDGSGPAAGIASVEQHALAAQITSATPELYAAFPGYGLWVYNGSTWSQLTPDAPQGLAAAGSILYGDFGGLGVWKYNGSSWSQLTPDNPENIVASESALYGDFGTLGLWKYDGSAWSQLTPDNPQTIAVSGSTLYGGFGALGLWKYDGTSWSWLTSDNPQNIAASGSILYGDFGALGLWKYDGASWSLLTGDNPENIAASGSILYGDFGALGLWKYDGTNWSQLTPDNPENIAASGSTLYGDFGTLGLWKYDGINWSRLTPDNPSVLATPITDSIPQASIIRQMSPGDYWDYIVSATYNDGDTIANLSGTARDIILSSTVRDPIYPQYYCFDQYESISVSGPGLPQINISGHIYGLQDANGSFLVFGEDDAGVRWIQTPPGYYVQIISPVTLGQEGGKSVTYNDGSTFTYSYSIANSTEYVSTGLGTFEAYKITSVGIHGLPDGTRIDTYETSYFVPRLSAVVQSTGTSFYYKFNIFDYSLSSTSTLSGTNVAY
jgi:hypothetical protein